MINIEIQEPYVGQTIVFVSGGETFLGIYMGKKQAYPISETQRPVPIFVINEWISFKLWP